MLFIKIKHCKECELRKSKKVIAQLDDLKNYEIEFRMEDEE